jgi:BASS family bile acid:Na+ symporter
MVYPAAFMTWLGVDLKILIVPLIQIIMFGMGTTLSVADFGRVFKMPWPVLVGFVLQFSVMPVTGLVLAKVFGFQAEVAAGVVLIGSCPGGVASNLMTYLAGGNVALSVTMTSCSTLVSPLMTPFLMDKLAGQFIEINFLSMMFGIINMIIVPIVAGLIANRILYSRHKVFARGSILALIGVVTIVLAAVIGFLAPSAVFTYGDAALSKDGFVVGLLLIGVVALAKLVISVLLKGPENWMDKALPIVSMAGICYIIAIITARSRDDLMAVGAYLIAAAIIHNFIGYILGYWFARAARLDESSCRTVAFEVGMQNGGMASGLAMNVLKSAPAALAPAIFGPWMNVSGSVLSTWWHRKPVKGASK